MPRILTNLACLPPKGIQVDRGAGDDSLIRLPLEKVLRTTVAVYAVGSGEAGPVTINFSARNPSPRLRWSISVGWEISAGAAYAAGAGSPTWQLRAVRRSAEAGATALLNNLFSAARALPDGYELDSAVKDIQGTLTLNNTDLATALAGNLVVEARWEPNGFIDDTLVQLLAQVDLQLVGGLRTIENTS